MAWKKHQTAISLCTEGGRKSQHYLKPRVTMLRNQMKLMNLTCFSSVLDYWAPRIFCRWFVPKWKCVEKDQRKSWYSFEWISQLKGLLISHELIILLTALLCLFQDPEQLQDKSNEILTAIIQGMRKEEPSNNVKLAATNALLNSLEFTKANFDKEVSLLWQKGIGSEGKKLELNERVFFFFFLKCVV